MRQGTRLEIVAELSASHLGRLERAHKIVDAAADAGADLFKVQVWKAGTMCIDPTYRVPGGPWAGQSLQQLYAECWTPWWWLPVIFQHCRDRGMEPFGSAFDMESVDYLESLGVKRHKVASFELVDLPLIRYMASKGKPIILSTGMAGPEEIVRAVSAANFAPGSCQKTTRLNCISAYPAEPQPGELSRFWWPGDHRKAWGEAGSKAVDPSDYGLSDHSRGIGIAVAAAALGAVMIEKHLTLSRADGGPDAVFSMEPDEFRQMVTECKRVSAAVEDGHLTKPGVKQHTELRRSLWVCRDIKAGDPLVLGQNVVTARPALGASPSTDLTGKVAAADQAANTPLTSWANA